MSDVIKALSQTSLPSILAFFGVFFIFLAIGGKLGAQIITDRIPKRYAGILGSILLCSSLALFVISLESNETQVEAAKKQDIDSEEAYSLHPALPMNQPISQATELEWEFYSTDKSTKCSLIANKEYLFTILGLDANGEPSVAKRKTVSDLTTTSCYITGKKEPQVTNEHGALEGVELLAHKTAEGIWTFDDPPSATENQKKAMRSEGFIDPFAGYPNEKVPVGKVITFKDEEMSMIFGTSLLGKKEGTVAIKFENVIKRREPIAQLSYSMNVVITTLDENNDEILIKMSLNGGGSLSLLENAKINSAATLTGIVTYTMSATPDEVLTGPATMKISIKEL